MVMMELPDDRDPQAEIREVSDAELARLDALVASRREASLRWLRQLAWGMGQRGFLDLDIDKDEGVQRAIKARDQLKEQLIELKASQKIERRKKRWRWLLTLVGR